MSDVTKLNPALRITPQGGETVINPAAGLPQDIPAGTVLPGEYVIQRRLDVPAGEADLFLCTKGGEEYAAKLYRRPIAVKSEVLEALSGVDCPYIAPLYYSGSWSGRHFEVLPYYRRGSLRGKKFSVDELKSRIIPEINEALGALHDAGIIHKDLKPSNIMQTDSGDVAIIDFGISSVQSDGSTIVVTSTGMTPEYSAPETFRRLFLEESDYYSFGITLYELFCGHTPYAEMTAEEIAQYTAIQRIPLPDGMPQELQGLITALTYCDLTNRRKRSSPNRRWTYTEVDNWLRGIPQPIPGETAPAQRGFPAYNFLNISYTDLRSLVSAFAENWEQGKKQVFRGLLSAFLKPYDPQLAGYALDAEEEVARGGDTDLAFFRLLYRLDQQTRAFFWKDRRFSGLAALGRFILNDTREHGTSGEFVREVLSRRLITEYLKCTGADDRLLIAARSFEDSAELNSGDTRRELLSRYAAGYALSDKGKLRIDELEFTLPEEINARLNQLLKTDALMFERLITRLVRVDGTLDPQFEAWLLSLGKRSEIDRWNSMQEV